MNYEEIIEKIEDIIEEGKPSFGGGGKIKVDGDAISECLKELSAAIPTEVFQARKIAAERREILQSAQETASGIISDAQDKAEAMTQEHEITKAAKDTALKILNEANEEANAIVDEANATAAELRENAEKFAYNLRSQAKDHAMHMMNECSEYLTANVAHFTENLELANLALSRLEKLKIIDPSDAE